MTDSPSEPRSVTPLLVVAMVLTALTAGWLVLWCAFEWIAYDDGYVGLLLPITMVGFTLTAAPALAGVFKRRDWARRWTLAVVIFNALNNAVSAGQGVAWLWLAVLTQAACAVALIAAKPSFLPDPKPLPVGANLGRYLAALAIMGALFVGIFVGATGGMSSVLGSEKGRESFAEDLRAAYRGAPVTVTVRGLDLIIEGAGDTDAQLEHAADTMEAGLAKSGKNAKAWVVGYQRMILTNGHHEHVIQRHD